MVGSLQVPQGLWRALERLPKQSPIFFQFSPRCIFGQPEKEKWSKWFEELTDECVEVWESLRLDSYSNERLFYVSEMSIEAQWGGGHEVMLVDWGIFGP